MGLFEFISNVSFESKNMQKPLINGNLLLVGARGFGSCHSLGSRVEGCGYGMCQKRGREFLPVAVRWGFLNYSLSLNCFFVPKVFYFFLPFHRCLKKQSLVPWENLNK